MADMVPIALVLALCLTGLAEAEYNISAFGMTSRTWDCELPRDCPDYTEMYLTNYGYLNPNPTKKCELADIQAALRKFQEFTIGDWLWIDGTCNNKTIENFDKQRCGCTDMGKDDKKMMMLPQNFYAPLAFNVGNNKWSKTHLKWKVTKYPQTAHNRRSLSNSNVDDAMKRALDIWAQKTPLDFEQVSSSSPADIDIRFETGRHTRDPPHYDFDGQGNVLAHAFFPESGVVHFDDDERFVLNSGERGTTELYIVAAHEFGHTLGIGHSNIEEALMAPYYRYAKTLTLHNDDVRAVQTLYGARRRPNVVTTRAPPRPVPTTPKTSMPDYCNMKIDAAFMLGSTTYVFTKDRNQRGKTIVYRVTRYGLDPNSRSELGDLFTKSKTTRWPRAHPYRVDAAAYIPNKRYVFLISGTRSYRYTYRSGKFYLDELAKFPKWMVVREFPQRPRAAVPMPLDGRTYYMMIFGTTMVWDWDFETQRVGAWAYPINSFGRNMPTNVHTAFLENSDNVVFIKNDQFIRFNLRYRRVMEDDPRSITSVKKDFFKGRCA